MHRLSDGAFLGAVNQFERTLAKLWPRRSPWCWWFRPSSCLSSCPRSCWARSWTDGEGLIRLLDRVLVILIGLEVLQNLTAYLREHVVQIELVLITALTAVARKVIVMPPGTHKSPGELIGLGVAVLCLAAAYWLVRQSHIKRRPTRTEQATGFPGQDP